MPCKRKKGEPKEAFLARFMEEMKDHIKDDKERMEAAEKEFEKDDMEEETFSLDNVEIFEAGKWNGDTYSERDLDDMVAAFEATKGALKPYLKLGHSNNQTLLQKDGYPAAGWITGIKRQGKKLLARLENVPEKIYKLINKKAYGRISSEIFWNLNFDGKKYRRALKAVALLGADTPEVHSLDDFINLYTEEYDAELKCYHILKDDTMDNEKILNDQIAELSKKVADLEKANESLMSENAELKEYTAKVEEEKRLSEVSTYLDGKLKDGYITPAQVKEFTALAMSEEVRTYTNGESQVVQSSSFDLVKKIIESGQKVVDFDKGTAGGDQTQKAYSKKPKSNEDETHEKIMNYVKENGVSYGEAYDIIAQEEVN